MRLGLICGAFLGLAVTGAQAQAIDLCPAAPSEWASILAEPMSGTWTMEVWDLRDDGTGHLEIAGPATTATVTLSAGENALVLSGGGFDTDVPLVFQTAPEWPLEDAGVIEGVGDLGPEAHELPIEPCAANSLPRVWSQGEVTSGQTLSEYDLAFYVLNSKELLGAVFTAAYDPNATAGVVRPGLTQNNRERRLARLTERRARVAELLASGTVNENRRARLEARLARIEGRLNAAYGTRVLSRAFKLTR